MPYVPLPDFIAAYVRVRAVTPTERVVSVMRKPIGRLVDGGFNYWHAVAPDGTEIRGDFGYGGWRRAMYALIRHALANGTLPEIPKGPPTTRAGWLRYLASFSSCGIEKTPATLYLSPGSDDATRHVSDALFPSPNPLPPGGYSRSHEQIIAEGKATRAVVAGLAAFQTRYRAYLNYLTEIKPGWRKVREIPYADNSVEVEEVSVTGATRTRQIVPPSGDLCF